MTHSGRSARAVVLACTLVACAALPLSAARAQLSTVRGMFITGAPHTDSATVFSRADMFAILETSTKRASGYQSSSYRAGAQVDVIPLGQRASLGVVLGGELKVSPDNNIGFDPHGAVWEEALVVSGRSLRWLRGGTWSVSGFLRCRHDIDNGTPPRSQDTAQMVPTNSRTIVLQGFSAGVAGTLVKTARFDLRAGTSAETYSRREDRRAPRVPIAPDWATARGALEVNLRASFATSARSAVYLRAWQSTAFFATRRNDGVITTAPRPESSMTNLRGEAGVRFLGAAGGIDLLVSRESTFDDAMISVPRAATFTSIGLRLSGPSLF